MTDRTNIDSRDAAASRLRTANRRTAAILASIAAVFFAGIFVSQAFGGFAVGMSIVGVGILLFLILAIGHGLISRK